ncbi:flagellin N-terminal helical domain-containing protein [Magnetococcus sp. PR-3]|uniref:flagellin N-terminal helical domain-containing protein n=1 Tax=Magnetococcus sp. PR-3 TaxID=3120355 RepID=UPI002FCE012E
MSLTIYGNVSSLEAKRASLRRAKKPARGTFNRLISGVESDAGEPVVLDTLLDHPPTNRLRSVNQARQNANAGISTIQVAEQALQETENALQRMQEITSRPIDGVMVDGPERAMYDQEVAQLVRDIDRLSEDPRRHSMQLLRGGLSIHTFAVGVGRSEEIRFSLGQTTAHTMGLESEVAWDDPQLAMDALANIHRAMDRVAQIRQELDQVQSRFNAVVERLSDVSEKALAQSQGIQSSEEAEKAASAVQSSISQQAEEAIAVQANQHAMLVSLLLN